MIRQIVDKFLEALSTGNFDLIKPYLAESVSMLTWAISQEKQILLEGMDNIKGVFDRFVSPPNDPKFEAETIVCDYPSAILWGKISGTTWIAPEGVQIEEQFELTGAFMLAFEGDNIQKIDFRADAFSAMKFSGKTVARSGDREKIKEYVEMIESLGLMPQIPDS